MELLTDTGMWMALGGQIVLWAGISFAVASICTLVYYVYDAFRKKQKDT